jgi:hypothetical protein
LTVFDVQDKAAKSCVWEIEVPEILEPDFIGGPTFSRSRHLDNLKDIIDEFLLRSLNDGEDFRFDGFPDIRERSARGGETVTEVIQVGINGEVVVRCPISEMKTSRDCKISLKLKLAQMVKG